MTREKVVELIPALRAFACCLCKSLDDADDLVQETLTKAIANLDQFQPGTKLKSWLFTIMRNSFNTNYRKSRREMVGLPLELLNSMSVEAGQNWSVRAKEVRRALLRLEEAHREVLLIVVLAGESYEDAAKIFNCPIGTIKSRLSRARKNLLIELGEQVEC